MPGMLTKRYFYKNPGFWRWGISIALIVLLIISFWKELSFVKDWVTGAQPLMVTDLTQVRNLFILAVSFVGFLGILYFSMMFVSQFVLPVHTATDRKRVFDRMLRYLSRSHGPAVFVREGREIAKPEELSSSQAGVAFVDLSSAIVLEKQYFAGGSRTVSGAGLLGKMGGSRKRKAKKGKEAAPNMQNARAAGPGIVFSGSGERIRGVVSLRRQFRLRTNVKGITRDGFEVFSHVFTLFTLGESPEVLKVTYTGEGPESIQVILIDEKTNTIKGFADDLDQDDKNEIHRWFQKYKSEPNPPEEPVKKTDPEQALPPYIFDPERVFNAVYGNARVIKEGLMEDWTELPLKVAVEAYHDMVAIENYDSLYLPEDPVTFPFRDEFRPRFAKRVRNLGVLGYQLVLARDGQPLEKGYPWEDGFITFYPSQTLRSSKILRDRGIRVIAAGFAELRPSNPAVLQQRLDHWRARWQKESNLTMAEFDYKEMKIRSHARAQAQQDMVQALSNLLKSQDLTREAVAIRLFQAMEAFAKEPQTEKLLPKETLNALWSLHEWLLPSGTQRIFPSAHPEKAFPDE
jgi:hypothetical protein